MNILVVDDDPLSREAVADFLREQLGHNVTELEHPEETVQTIREANVSLVLTDIRMPGQSGLKVLERIKSDTKVRHVDVVLITGYADLNSSVQALRKGAFDYLQKPVNVEELADVVVRSQEHQQELETRQNNRDSARRQTPAGAKRPEQSDESYTYAEVVGVGTIGFFSPRMKAVAAMAETLHGDRQAAVLIQGETGTGKEIIARLVHYGPGESGRPFVAVNCSAVSASLFESELFGYEEGAFTGARRSGMPGKLEMADGGTIFLDEIGDLPPDMQPKLLRALQEREVYRIGGSQPTKLDIRVICATNRDLEQEMKAGRFREDLFYRINVGRIAIPPLRERREEVVPLAQLFLIHYATRKGKHFQFINSEARKALREHDWPGNVRELKNVIERATLLYDADYLGSEHLGVLSGNKAEDPAGTPLRPGHLVLPQERLELESLEREIVQKAMEMFDGNKTRVAEYLGITRSALRSRLKE